MTHDIVWSLPGNSVMFRWDATPVLSRVNTPVLIIVGQEDTTTLPSASEYMRSTMPVRLCRCLKADWLPCRVRHNHVCG
jgi:pimeloyl-ACP methyl ester carboxylesterase